MSNLFIDKKDLDILKNILNLYDDLPQSFKDEIDKNNVKIYPEN